MYLLFAGNKESFVELLKRERPTEVYAGVLDGTLSNGVPRRTLYVTFPYRDGMIAMYRSSALGFDEKRMGQLRDEARELEKLGEEVGYRVVGAVLTLDPNDL